MTWERALEADARLAAKNAVLIRAALRQAIDPERIYAGYLNTTPDKTLTLPQQRVRARAWAIMNVRVNLEPLKEVVYRLWAQAYSLGDLAAREAVRNARLTQKAGEQAVIDWSKWKPGDAVAALLLKPPRAFQQLLEQQGITFKGFSDTTLTDIGNSVGEAIYLGLDAKQSAKLIGQHVANPARALSIAITEQNRAISQATVNRYKDAGLTQQEWLVFEPCNICAKNANVKTNIGTPFPSGDLQPPAHPHCRCALAPVIPGMEEANLIPGGTVVAPPAVVSPVASPFSSALTREEFVPGQWEELKRHEVRELIVTRAMAAMPDITRKDIEDAIMFGRMKAEDLEVLEEGIFVKNGPLEVIFIDAGKGVNAANRQALFKEIDELQKLDPKDRMTLVVTNRGAANTYGSAVLGDAKIWIKPHVVRDNDPLTKEVGFKMPVIATVPHRQYTLTHEWGHSRDVGGHFARKESVQNNETKFKILKLQKKYATDPQAFISNYARENTKEFYAEMYAEWILTKGATTNPLVREMAETFGWNKFGRGTRSGPFSPIVERDEYRGLHQAPVRADGFGAPATNIGDEMMPDFYERPNIYTTGMPQSDKESVAVLMRIRDKPEEIVTIYRAVPVGVDKINPGDWVTFSRSYAEAHRGNVGGPSTIISMKVRAKDLWFDGNSINEFGYDPVKDSLQGLGGPSLAIAEADRMAPTSMSVARNKEIEEEINEMRALIPAKDVDDKRLIDAFAARGPRGEADNTDIYWPLKKKFQEAGMSEKDAKWQVQGILLRAQYYLENKKIVEEAQEQMAEWTKAGFPDDVVTYKKNIEIATKEITNAVENGKVTIAITRPSLRAVFADGRFKSQFETKSSGGVLDTDLRKIREKATLDVEVNTKPKQRPIYGFVHSNTDPVLPPAKVKTVEDQWRNRLSLFSNYTDQYGMFRVVLKDSVKARTTVTIGDSLNKGILADSMEGGAPDLVNMGLYRQGAPTHTLGDPTAAYLEAQISEGVTLDDIASIYVSGDENYKEVVELVKESGKDIQVVQMKEAK